MSTVLSNAGAVGFLVAAGVVVGLLVAAVCAFMALRKHRVPLTALVVLPYFVLALGALGGLTALIGVAGDVSVAEPSKIPLVAMSGAWNAMAVDVLSRWGAALVLVAGAWAAAIGAFLVPGPESRFTPMAAIVAALLTLIGSVTIAVYGSMNGVGGEAFGLASLLFVGGLGVAVGAMRRAADENMWRVASLRFASSMSLFFGVFHASRAIDIGNRMEAFAATGPIMSATELGEAIAAYGTFVDPGVTLGIIGVIFAVVIAFFGFFSEIGEVVDRFTMFDVFGVVALILVVAGLRFSENRQFEAVVAVARNTPAVELYGEYRPELPVAAVSQGDVTSAVRLVEGGFGDVLVLEKDEWIRLWRWNGRTWVEDHEKLATAKLDAKPPLLAIPRNTDAAKVIEVLQISRQAYLMLRASEVKGGARVPAELGRLQVTMLPLALSQTRDLKTQAWIEAGAPEANWGPTVWFGEGDDNIDAVAYANTVLSATGSTGIHIAAAKRRIGDVVATCLPYVVAADAVVATDPLAMPPGTPPAAPGAPPGTPIALLAPGILPPPKLHYEPTRWCAITGDEVEAVRLEAAALWEIPAPANVMAEVITEGELTLAEVDDRIRRELGAIGYCAEKAVEGGEKLKGRMTLLLAVSKDGQVYDTRAEEKSKVQSPSILRCAAKRFRKLDFTMPEPPPPPAPPEPGQEPVVVEPPPAPKVIVHLDF